MGQWERERPIMLWEGKRWGDPPPPSLVRVHGHDGNEWETIKQIAPRGESSQNGLCPWKAARSIRRLWTRVRSGRHLEESEGGVGVGLRSHRVWWTVKREGAPQTGSPGNPDSTSHPLASAVLPSTNVWVVRGGARLLLPLLALSV